MVDYNNYRTKGANYYLLTALPGLGDQLDNPIPLSPKELLEHVRGNSAPEALVKAILLGDDLLQRQSFLAGETPEPAAVVLSDAQIRNEEPLPAYLQEVIASESTANIADNFLLDRLWEAYYRYGKEAAEKCNSAFLSGWIGYNVGLNNALVTARARALDLEVEGYLVAEDLASEDDDFASVVNEWSGAAQPLDGLLVIDTARWDWLMEHEAWFSFSDDELAVYAAKLMLQARWQRLKK
jgi:hypothetical protein